MRNKRLQNEKQAVDKDKLNYREYPIQALFFARRDRISEYNSKETAKI